MNSPASIPFYDDANKPAAIMNYRDLETPALLVDLDLMEKNIRRMSEFFRGKKAKLRPHVKNHKTPIIALKEIKAGAVGVAVAKLEEAEVFAWSGVNNIMIMSQIVTDEKIEKLVNLSKQVDVIVAVDNPDNVAKLSSIAQRKGAKLNVVIEVDIGQHRAGVTPGEPALNLAKKIVSSPGLRFRGIGGYEGHISLVKDPSERKMEDEKSLKLLVETRDLLEKNGIPVEIVSAGGTGIYNIAGVYPGITEVQAGSYVMMDVVYRDCGIDFDCALSVLATVISVPSEDRAILDTGVKSVTTNQGLPEVKNAQGIEVTKLSAEHMHLKLAENHMPLKVGDKVEVLPSDCDTTVNLHDRLYGIRNGEVEVVWPILARGKFR
ncbi:MAG: DSD1 family PLP-dependent enzyme [Thaumarchaeota archaeon]|nr:DSD1 family PLP-dependent enzyme [Nitrososphaerota archaeon]